MVTPPCDTPVVTQLRLISTPDPLIRSARKRADRPLRSSVPVALRLDARTREVGLSGVAEARRRLAEIHATAERAQALVRAS